jgi:outer membrane protein insertion porin family
MRNHSFMNDFGFMSHFGLLVASSATTFGRIWRPRTVAFCLFTFYFFSACNNTKHLGEGETVLSKNKIIIKKNLKVPGRNGLQVDGLAQVKQRPEKPLMGIVPNYRSWVYQKRKCENGKFVKRFRRYICTQFATQPVVYDPALTKRTEENLRNFLQGRGFFDAEVTYKTKVRRKKTKVSYYLVPHERYKIASFEVVCQDSVVNILLKKHQKESFLKPNLPLDSRLFDQEKTRISRLLRNNGFALFVPNFLEFEGDTTNRRTKVVMTVLPFSRKNDPHPTLKIGQVTVQIDCNLKRPILLDTIVDGVRFMSNYAKLAVEPSVLLNAIMLRGGETYRETNLEKTNLRLTNLGSFKFIAVRPQRDTGNSGKINMDISLSRTKKSALQNDFALNYGNSLSRDTWVLGLLAGGTVKNRNLFHKSHQFSIGSSYEIEFQPNGSRPINSQNFHAQVDYLVPRFVDYFGLWKGISRLPDDEDKLLKRWLPNFVNALKNEAQLRFTLNYDYRELFNFYVIHTITGNLGYAVRLSPRRNVSIRHIGVDMLVPNTKSGYDQILNKNLFLKKSFGKNLQTGLILRDFEFKFLSNTNPKSSRNALRFHSDLSGFEVASVGKIIQAAKWVDDDFQPKLGSLPFAQFLRLDLDLTSQKSIGRKMMLAGRFSLGMAEPFGFSREVPYLTQQIIGGPYSLRGWPLRKIGPGGYNDPINIDNPDRSPYYQSGDFRVESSVEWRFPIYSIWEGAAFLDAGNVWTWRDDPNRKGSGLANFSNEIAANTGLGLRGDLGFFILRTDFGLPLRNNFKNENGQYWVYGKNGQKANWSDWNWNLAIGFPF